MDGSETAEERAIFYEGRRRFLKATEKKPMRSLSRRGGIDLSSPVIYSEGDALKPPNEFLTRYQARRAISSRGSMTSLSQIINTMANVTTQKEPVPSKKSDKRKKETVDDSKPAIVIDTRRYRSAEYWQHEFQGGVSYYRHLQSGEISEACPWETPMPWEGNSKEVMMMLSMKHAHGRVTTPGRSDKDMRDREGRRRSRVDSMGSTGSSSNGSSSGLSGNGMVSARMLSLGWKDGDGGGGGSQYSSQSNTPSLLLSSSQHHDGNDGRYEGDDHDHANGDDDEDGEIGTGSLVYDPSEFEVMMKLLDGQPKSPSHGFLPPISSSSAPSPTKGR